VVLAKVLLTDVCVPVSHLARCIAQSEADFHAHNMPCIICAHIADGNFHCLIPYQPDEVTSPLASCHQHFVVICS
jgi:D-lactate dehydrogenase (cytochrome)